MSKVSDSRLHDVEMYVEQPRRLQRYLQTFVDNPESVDRLAANNLLATSYWHQNLLTKAIDTFKLTVAWNPESIEGVWAMKMLSCLYFRLGLRSERIEIDMQRLRCLRKILHTSEEADDIRFACDELRRECEDRDLWDFLRE